MRYCEFCGRNEMTASDDEIVAVVLDDNMETYLCDPTCVRKARSEMKVEVLD